MANLGPRPTPVETGAPLFRMGVGLRGLFRSLRAGSWRVTAATGFEPPAPPEVQAPAREAPKDSEVIAEVCGPADGLPSAESLGDLLPVPSGLGEEVLDDGRGEARNVGLRTTVRRERDVDSESREALKDLGGSHRATLRLPSSGAVAATSATALQGASRAGVPAAT